LSLIRVSDIDAAAQVLWATIHGLTSLLIAHPRFPFAERNVLIDTLIENALAGLQVQRPVLAS
jgi:hypothetical protein